MSSASEVIDRKTARKAAGALIKQEKTKEGKGEGVHLLIGLKRIPEKNELKPLPQRIELPNPFYKLKGMRTCLIVKNGEAEKLKSLKEKEEKNGNPAVDRIVGITELRTEFKKYEYRIKLAKSFNLFLVDVKVAHLMPALLGSIFFKQKRMPFAIRPFQAAFEDEVERAKSGTFVTIRGGTCVNVKVALSSQGKQQVADNILAAAESATQLVPHGLQGVQSFHVSCESSVTLPLYERMPEDE